MGLKSRLTSLARLYTGAVRFHVPFVRRATFKPPRYVKVGRRWHALSFPDEEGVKWDFVSVILEDVYGIRATKRPLERILDVGSNVGFFGVAARERFPDALIHAYEPNPVLQSHLTNQAKEFDFRYFAEAVGGHGGKVNMTFGAGTDTNLGRVDEAGNGSIAKIPLEEAVARLGGHVDFMKMDCESGEWEMFEESKCWSSIQAISMEYHLFHGETHQEVADIVRNLGYSAESWVYDPACHYGHLRASRAL